jgi:NitT/TauT family transport system substrate-binding protein
MKGKRVGTNAIGSASDTAIRAMLLKHGMRDKRDYTVVEAAFPNIPAMLESGKIDLGTVLQPTSDQLIATGKYRPLFRAKDAIGPSQLVFLTARADFLDKNRAALKDFFEDYVRAFRWFEDPANKKQAVAIVAKFMNQDPAKLDYIFTKRDYYRDPFMVPNVKTIQSSIDVAQNVGLIKKGIKVAPDHVDLSFVQEAKRRILADKH